MRRLVLWSDNNYIIESATLVIISYLTCTYTTGWREKRGSAGWRVGEVGTGRFVAVVVTGDGDECDVQ